MSLGIDQWEFILAYEDKLHRLCVSMSRGDTVCAADDLWSDVVLVRVQNILDTWDGRVGLWSHVQRSLRWYAYKYVNALRKRPVSYDEALDVREEPSPESSLEEVDEVQFVIAQLDPVDRSMLVMRDVQGMTFREIGVVLGVGKDTARKYYDSALARARTIALRDGAE